MTHVLPTFTEMRVLPLNEMIATRDLLKVRLSEAEARRESVKAGTWTPDETERPGWTHRNAGYIRRVQGCLSFLNSRIKEHNVAESNGKPAGSNRSLVLAVGRFLVYDGPEQRRDLQAAFDPWVGYYTHLEGEIDGR